MNVEWLTALSKHLEIRKRRFGDLFDSHGASLMAMLRRMARNNHDADEVFQETALRVWKNLSKAPQIRNPRAWLTTIGYRTFLDIQSRRSKGGQLQEYWDNRQASPLAEAERLEEAERVNAFVAALPNSVRDVVVLHYCTGLSLRETAAAMGVPLGTVKSRLNQALGILRKTLL